MKREYIKKIERGLAKDGYEADIEAVVAYCLSHTKVLLLNILCEPAKPCETAHYAAFPDNRPPQLLRIYYQGMSFDTTKHREMRTYGTAPPFEQPPKITYRPTG